LSSPTRPVSITFEEAPDIDYSIAEFCLWHYLRGDGRHGASVPLPTPAVLHTIERDLCDANQVLLPPEDSRF
jgi:hypothetical protein